MDTQFSDIRVFYVDKKVIEAVGPVVHTDKNGFFYCKKGTLRLILDDNIYEIHEGDIYIYPPFSVTYIDRISDKLEGVVGMAEFDFVLTALTSITDTGTHAFIREHPCISLSASQRHELEELIDIINRTEATPQDGVKYKLRSALAQAICYEIVDAFLSCNHIQPVKQTRKDKIVQNFLLDVHKYFRENRNVSFYAEKQYLTPRYFSTIIKAKSGKSPNEWITFSVMAEAKRLLADPNISIKEITDKLNFPNQSFFGRYFKHHTGFSPSEYRAKKVL